jgi:hypothetical protein
VLRAIAPNEQFTLAADPALKARALRDPRTRAAAAQLYGLKPPDALMEAPDLGSLLHGPDDCALCRSRAKLQRGPSDL